MTENRDNIIALGDSSELERLVKRCIEHLKKDGNICEVRYPKDAKYASECVKRNILCGCRVYGPVWKDEYSDRVVIPNGRGNLYAVHVRCCGQKWRLKYVGKSRNLRRRLSAHFKKTYAGPNSTTHSELWRVAHYVSRGCKVGVSFATITVGLRSNEADYAIAGYVESRIIDRLGAEHLWNKRRD